MSYRIQEGDGKKRDRERDRERDKRKHKKGKQKQKQRDRRRVSSSSSSPSKHSRSRSRDKPQRQQNHQSRKPRPQINGRFLSGLIMDNKVRNRRLDQQDIANTSQKLHKNFNETIRAVTMSQYLSNESLRVNPANTVEKKQTNLKAAPQLSKPQSKQAQPGTKQSSAKPSS